MMDCINNLMIIKLFFLCQCVWSWIWQNYKIYWTEIIGFIKGSTETYHRFIENTLSCHVFNCYKYFDVESDSLPGCRPFKYYLYCHTECLDHWKKFQLKSNKEIAKLIKCSTCKIMVKKCFIVLYAFD